jgi:iron(III) transport system permease protein
LSALDLPPAVVARPSVRVRRGRRFGRPGWVLAPVVVALLAIAPIAMLATSVVRPNTDVWRQQWETRLPDQIITTIVLTVGVVVASVVVGVGLAWLVGAHRFPGRRVLSWALVLPLAMPSYILGFVTTAVFGVAGSGGMPGSPRSVRCRWPSPP